MVVEEISVVARDISGESECSRAFNSTTKTGVVFASLKASLLRRFQNGVSNDHVGLSLMEPVLNPEPRATNIQT